MKAFDSKSMKRTCLPVLLLAVLANSAQAETVSDPLEPLNRGVYHFNDAMDKVLLKPAALFYGAVMPEPGKKAASNFFSNLGDLSTAINGLLQFKFSQAANDASRFVFNSTFGLFGLIDVASGLEKHDEDFGQTLGYWGVGAGPYLVLPFFGPSSVRDAAGIYADRPWNAMTYIDDSRSRNQFAFAKAVQARYQAFEQEAVLNEAALDRYAFIRDSYMQYRQNQVYDGNPPIDYGDELDHDADGKAYLPGFRVVDKTQYSHSDVVLAEHQTTHEQNNGQVYGAWLMQRTGWH